MSDNLLEQAERSDRAKRILEDAVYKDAVEGLRNKWISAWENSPVMDIEGREQIYMMILAIREVESNLRYTMESGKLAKAELTLMEKAKEKFNSFKENF